MVVEVAQKSWLIAGLTGSSDDLSAAVERIGTPEGKQSPLLGPVCRNKTFPHSCGGTALWHGLYYTAKELKPVPGRKAIVVLSDGLDTGSDIRLNDVIEMAQSAGTVVYSIKYASPMRFLSISGAIAQAVSHGTGARLARDRRPDLSESWPQDLRGLFEDRIRSAQYVCARFQSPRRCARRQVP